MKLKLKTKTFLTVSVDNIDVNIQSSVSTISLHGTVACINQHRTRNNEGQSRELVNLN